MTRGASLSPQSGSPSGSPSSQHSDIDRDAGADGLADLQRRDSQPAENLSLPRITEDEMDAVEMSTEEFRAFEQSQAAAGGLQISTQHR